MWNMNEVEHIAYRHDYVFYIIFDNGISCRLHGKSIRG